METDASDGIVAGVISQMGSDSLQYPVRYFSKVIQLAELNYEIYNKEMLAIVRSLANWRAELQGSLYKLKILIDYRLLEYFMTTKDLTTCQTH